MNERYKPRCTERYYYIRNKGDVDDVLWCDDTFDHEYYEFGNCFRTKKEATNAAKKVKALLLSLHEPTKDCNHLPKLTAEVFDRPDCPEWAKYAAVDLDGMVCYFDHKPTISQWSTGWERNDKYCPLDGRYDSSNWQNSLIERPVKETALPDWCKVGEWCFCLDDDGDCKYFKIAKIKDNFIYGEDWDIDYHFVKQARLRPYNADEMKSLMGKVIEKGPSMHIVTGFENVFDNECMVHVNGCLYSANDLLRQFAIDNAPCGVLEHLNDKGEWVE